MADSDFIFDMVADSVTLSRRTALSDSVPVVVGDNELRECDFLGKVIIRGDLGDSQFCSKVEKICGLSVPSPCRFSSSEGGDGDSGCCLLWLGPDELLYYCLPRDVVGVVDSLRSGFAGMHGSVIEVSDYYTVFRLSGSGVVDLLASEMVLDLRLREFPIGGCAGSIYANAQVILCRLGEDDFLVQVRWSFADYLWNHLGSGMKFV